MGFSWFTLQITHKIGEKIDEERDYILHTLGEGGAVESVHWVENYFSGYHSRNGGGDVISTDGTLPVVALREPQAATDRGKPDDGHASPRGRRLARPRGHRRV